MNLEEWLQNAPEPQELNSAINDTRTRIAGLQSQLAFLQGALTVSSMNAQTPEEPPKPKPKRPSCFGDTEMFDPEGTCEDCSFIDLCAKKVASSIALQDDS